MTFPQQPSQPDPSPEAFLMGGGGGAPTAKFPPQAYGTTISGRITERPGVEQQRDIKDNSLKFWPDGNKRMQLVVTVQTEQRDPSIEDDDGRRRLFVKGQLQKVIADAVRAVGAAGLEVGGILSVTYTHDGQSSGPGMSPPKQYSAQYVSAATAMLHAPTPATAAPPQQQYAPPAAAVPPTTPQFSMHGSGMTGAPAMAAATASPAPDPTAALTPEQLANPAIAALVAQQQAQQAAPPLSPPPF
ncbi:hypothetical protein [Streptomyces xanthophaeus]|uniref:hypothetical protein n=1 Tax=Streptomyces xanthophaeus TaxID=67385 RepID=UPI003655764D